MQRGGRGCVAGGRGRGRRGRRHDGRLLPQGPARRERVRGDGQGGLEPGRRLLRRAAGLRRGDRPRAGLRHRTLSQRAAAGARAVPPP